MRTVRYDDLAAAVMPTGMCVRGGFVDDDGTTIVIVGNVGGEMWPHFTAERRDEPNPLDSWTRRTLGPIAERFGADFVHPSDEPFRPFQRWAQRADDVWQSPIGLLVHREHGLWHAYRGAFVFAAGTAEVTDIPPTGSATSPCLTCDGQPCLSTCPVDAFTPGGYAADSCRAHVATGDDPACGTLGCAARRACPLGHDAIYGDDQMAFHMRAFVGG